VVHAERLRDLPRGKPVLAWLQSCFDPDRLPWFRETCVPPVADDGRTKLLSAASTASQLERETAATAWEIGPDDSTKKSSALRKKARNEIDRPDLFRNARGQPREPLASQA
jgi:hypothetical protein